VNSLRLDVNFIVVSDHGMTSIDVENTLSMPTVIDKSQFIYTGGDAIIELYAKDNKDILPAYNKLKQQEKNFTAYLKEDLPEHLVYSLNEDRFNRIGDIVLLSHHPYIFNFSERKPDPGYHGFDPGAVKDMQTIFYAWGPAFKKNKVLPSLKIVDVYPLIARILKLNYEHEIDGNIVNIVKILRSD
ncbi:MAG: alkaline phosphatase family protein, partial [Bacteroidota bacterium]|nr:alkaline phosphatase family protein [Bacteroidota bacterium]